MQVTKQGQTAILSMLTMAIHHGVSAVRLSDLAGQQGVSVSYLEGVFARLRLAELVEGIRGPGGGYCLTRQPDSISLADIVQAMTGDEKGVTIKAEEELIGRVWASLCGRFDDFMSEITLYDLVSAENRAVAAYRMSDTASMIARMFPAAPRPEVRALAA